MEDRGIDDAGHARFGGGDEEVAVTVAFDGFKGVRGLGWNGGVGGGDDGGNAVAGGAEGGGLGEIAEGCAGAEGVETRRAVRTAEQNADVMPAGEEFANGGKAELTSGTNDEYEGHEDRVYRRRRGDFGREELSPACFGVYTEKGLCESFFYFWRRGRFLSFLPLVNSPDGGHLDLRFPT